MTTNSSSSETNILRKFRDVTLWRCRRFICQLFQTFVRRLIRRINISKVADETNTFCAAALPSGTAGDLSAGAAPSPGAAMLYSAPCYHSYSPLSCYQVRSSSPFISCSSVLVFPMSSYQMWCCSKSWRKYSPIVNWNFFQTNTDIHHKVRDSFWQTNSSSRPHVIIIIIIIIIIWKLY